ncbi:hypothetical protein CEV34_3216 [Brucella pseudogrignonensis]|uniref:Uncharacterized protein n=1 Tax=Brucella pseudogrignonensis TaxID=419475 RepID=A0A256GAF6_9HYPH|nr:hypothetical protein CEV34_3216 [Brucella pseudogrignonensis]
MCHDGSPNKIGSDPIVDASIGIIRGASEMQRPLTTTDTAQAGEDLIYSPGNKWA